MKRHLLEYGFTVIVAAVAVLLIQAYLVKPYRVPSHSMAVAIAPEDRVLVSRALYRWQEPQRGDIVVVDSAAAGLILIKRVVGLPGETISVAGGSVFVDGRRLTEPYLGAAGVEDGTSPLDNGQPWALADPYDVPPGHYFVLGDNRPVSADSRSWGPVPRHEIVGAAFATYWPVGRLGRL